MGVGTCLIIIIIIIRTVRLYVAEHGKKHGVYFYTGTPENLEGWEKSAKKPFARRVELTIYFYVEERRALVMHKKKSKEEERKEKEPDPNFLASI